MKTTDKNKKDEECVLGTGSGSTMTLTRTKSLQKMHE